MSAFARSVGRAIGAWWFTRDMGNNDVDFKKIDIKSIQGIYCSAMDAQYPDSLYQTLDKFLAVQNKYEISEELFELLKTKTGMGFLTKKEHMLILTELEKAKKSSTEI